MKRNKILTLIACFAGLMALTSCGTDFLTTESAGDVEAGGPATEAAIFANVVAAYQILLFDSYANFNYNGVLLMSDLRSDDLFKGGESAGDQQQLYALATFTSTPALTTGGLWSIYYSGLARANHALASADKAVPEANPDKVKRYRAEALFLRAYYGHLLWKFWGNIPYFTENLTFPYVSPQLSADEVYAKIMTDIAAAEALNTLPMNTTGDELGRANKAALLMLKARVVMYQKDNSKYAEVANDMASIIMSNKYELFNNFANMWKKENSFNIESIFEVNHQPTGKSWGGAWAGYGTNLPAFISPSELNDPAGVFKGGWGFGPVRPEVWDMFAAGDTRREGSINNWVGGNYNPRFQDTGYGQGKYAARVGYNNLPGDQDLNYCNNLVLFRFAETLLNYAELVGINGVAPQQGISAQDCFNRVRNRAFNGVAPAVTLNATTLKQERRFEFVGEGMRFWDLVRWGDAVTALTENITCTTPGTATKPDPVVWSWTRTFTADKKYLPIPESEISATKGTAYPLEQNPGW